jgi:hypothetical protein
MSSNNRKSNVTAMRFIDPHDFHPMYTVGISVTQDNMSDLGKNLKSVLVEIINDTDFDALFVSGQSERRVTPQY